MRILFAGTPEFAVPPLESLLSTGGHEICAVYTQPDRPAGRGRKVLASPVKQIAAQHGLEVRQPSSLKDPATRDALRLLEPELMVVVAYGLILPQDILDIPPLGCVNIHASLLPRWRGAAPIQRAVQAGDAETGVTIMFMERRLDAGPMLLQRPCPIDRRDTSGDVHDRLARLGAEALLEVLPALAAGTTRPEAQNEAAATYAAKLDKAEATLDFTRPARELERQILAFNPWPVAETSFNGQVLRVWRAEAVAEPVVVPPGTVLNGGKTLDVATGDGILRLTEVQLAGGRRISAQDFRNAHPREFGMLGHSA